MKVVLKEITSDQSDNLILSYKDRPAEFIGIFSSLLENVNQREGAACFIDNTTVQNFINSASAVYENHDKYPFHYFKKRIESVLTKYQPSEAFSEYLDYEATYFHCNWSNGSFVTTPINGSVLSNISEFLLVYEEEVIVYSVGEFNQIPNKRFTILKDNDRTDYKAETININFTDSLDDIRTWLDENNRRKKFKANPKHGIAGRGNKKGEAILYCKTSDEAQDFLNKAIKSERGKDLYVYDRERRKWLVFKNDNFKIFVDGEFIERYHAYHVEQADENVQIPPDIAATL